MSSASVLSPWEVLGVERGASADAVRRAYARRLKGVSPEDDPAGFMALRQAFEAALRNSQAAVSPIVAVEPGRTHASTEAAASAAPRPAAERRGSETLADAFATLLRVAPARPQETQAALEAFLQHPDMELLSARAAAEGWLAVLLAEAIPASDPHLETVIRFFGWTQKGVGRQGGPVLALLQRADALDAARQRVRSLEFRSHSLQAGWKALTDARSRPIRRELSALSPDMRLQVLNLFAMIGKSPALERFCADEALAWWRVYFTRPNLSQALRLAPVCVMAALYVITGALDLRRSSPQYLLQGVEPASLLVGCVVAWIFTSRLGPKLASWASAQPPRIHLQVTAALALVPLTAAALPSGSPALVVCGGLIMAALAWRAMQPEVATRFALSTQQTLTGLLRAALLLVVSAPLLAEMGVGYAALWLAAAIALHTAASPAGAPLAAALVRAPAAARRTGLTVGFAASLLAPYLLIGGDLRHETYLRALGWLSALIALRVGVRTERRRVAAWLRIVGFAALLTAYIAAFASAFPVTTSSGVPPASLAGAKLHPADRTDFNSWILQQTGGPAAVAIPASPSPVVDCDAPGAQVQARGLPPRLCAEPIVSVLYGQPVLDMLASDEGHALVWLILDASGRITDCSVQEAWGDPALAESACRRIESDVRYAPARLASGRTTSGSTLLAVHWHRGD